MRTVDSDTVAAIPLQASLLFFRGFLGMLLGLRGLVERVRGFQASVACSESSQHVL